MTERNIKTINLKYIVHKSKTDTCIHYHFMEVSGISYARAYTFNDDSETIYLDSLNVLEAHRHKGVGFDLQKQRESLGVSLGFKYSCLWVENNSWMLEWYKRRGYTFYSNYDKKEGCVWLRKELK